MLTLSKVDLVNKFPTIPHMIEKLTQEKPLDGFDPSDRVQRLKPA